MHEVKGGCLCGSIRYESADHPALIAACHCTHCQKQSGGAFSVNLVMPLAGVKLTGSTLATFNDVNVWLGRSNWSGDQNTQGEFDEARFYDYVLTPGQAVGNAASGPDLINDKDVAVTSTTPPTDQSIPETLPATFRVAVKGSAPITYQWFRNNDAIMAAIGGAAPPNLAQCRSGSR